MSDIDFKNPETYEQIEAIGALHKALFKLGEVYGLTRPGELIKEEEWGIQYHLGNMLKKQNEPDKPADSNDLTDQEKKDVEDIPF